MIPTGMIATKTASMAAKFKRRSIVDIIFLVGMILVVVGFTFACLTPDKSILSYAAIGIIGLGVTFLVYGLFKYNYLIKHNPDLLKPEEAQINTKIANLLTDNISEQNKIEIVKALVATTPKNLGEA